MPELDTNKTIEILTELLVERERQHEKFGKRNLPETGIELSDDVNASCFAYDLLASCSEESTAGQPTYRMLLDDDIWEAFEEAEPSRLRGELVQIGAVVVEWIEALDRKKRERIQRGEVALG